MYHGIRRTAFARLLLVLLIVWGCLGTSGVPGSLSPGASITLAQTPEPPPNVLLILLDDLDYLTLNRLVAAGKLPYIKQHLIDQGTTFTNAYATNPLCCPSRATFFTGQYAHNHELWSNSGNNSVETFDSGWDHYKAVLKNRSVQRVLKDNGYFTGLVGKFMNGTTVSHADFQAGTNIPDDAWSLFFPLLDPQAYYQYGYVYRRWYPDVQANGIGPSPGVNVNNMYQTDVLAWETFRAIYNARHLPGGGSKPFFMVYAPTVPHIEPDLQADPYADPLTLNWPMTSTVSMGNPTPAPGLTWSNYAESWKLHTRGRLHSYTLDNYTFTATSPGRIKSANGSYTYSVPARSLRKPWNGSFWEPLSATYDLPNWSTTGAGGDYLVGESNRTGQPFWMNQGFGSTAVGSPPYTPATGWPVLNRSSDAMNNLKRQQLGRQESLLALDDAINYLFTKLAAQKLDESNPNSPSLLSNTMIILTSDNGFLLGEHNLGEKRKPYEEAIRIPLIIRVPNVPGGRTESRVVLNNDIAPTIAHYAKHSAGWTGGPVAGFNPDGRSLMPLLDPSYGLPFQRTRFLIEHKAVVPNYAPWTSSGTRYMPFFEVPHYNALRTIVPGGENSLYATYDYRPSQYAGVATGQFPTNFTQETEFINMLTDPNQMQPGAPPANPLYAAQLQGLTTCEGAASCSAWEGVSPHLYAINKTDSPQTSVHVLNRADNFQSYLLNTYTAYPASGTDNSYVFLLGDYNGDGKQDLYVVRKTDSPTASIHVLNGATNFQTYLLQTYMPHASSGNDHGKVFLLGDYNNDGKQDLYAIWKTDSPNTSVHVLNGATNFQTYLLETYTVYPTSGTTNSHLFLLGDYNNDGKQDLYVVRKTDSPTASIHVMNGANNFQSFLLQTYMPHPSSGSDSSKVFLLGDYNGDSKPDLYAIWKTDSPNTSIHVLNGATNYQSNLLDIYTVLSPTGSNDAWVFQLGN